MTIFEVEDENKFHQIISSYKSQLDTYGYTILKSILVKHNDEWRNHVTRIQPQYKKEELHYHHNIYPQE